MGTKHQIPEFDSREEEAAFWDTHDFKEFINELKPVRVRIDRGLTEDITARLDERSLASLRDQASSTQA